MKTCTKRQRLIRNIAGLFVMGVSLAPSTAPLAQAQLYWDSNGTTAGAGATPTGTWGTSNFWNTDSAGGALGVFQTTTTSTNDVFFSAGTDAVNSYTVTLNGSQNARLVTFEEGTVTLDGGSLGLGGAGGFTVGTAAVSGATINSDLSITGNSTFNIAAAKTLTLSNSGTFTRNTGATLNVQGTGTVNTTMTGLTSGSLSNDIIGPWASFNTGASSTYATIDGSNNIVGLTYAGGTSGTAAAASTNVSDTSGVVNYTLGAVGTLGTSASVNTLRYTGAAGTLTTATSFATNGIMNAGTGTLTLSGNITIGSTKELVVNAANAQVTISNVIANNAGGASRLIKTGSSNLLLSSLANTYTGGTIVNQGTLTGPVGTNSATERPFGDAAGVVTMNPGSTLALDRTYVPNPVVLNSATITAGNSFTSNLVGGVTLNGANTFNITGGLAIQSNITGTGTLTKSGTSSLLIGTAANNNSKYDAGPLTISGGGLIFAGASSLFDGTSSTWTPANITVGSGAVLSLRYGSGTSDFNSSQIDTIINSLRGNSNNGLLAGSFIGIDTTTGNTSYSNVIADSTGPGGGAIGLNKSGGNTLTLSGANTFSGPVSIGGFTTQNGGNLSVSSFNSVNNGSPTLASSSLGRPTTQANGTITFGVPGSNSASGIIYTGTGETTDRILMLNSGGGGMTVDQSGTGLLKFTGNLGNTSNGARTFTIQGSTAGTAEISGVITDAGLTGTNALSINKTGTGTWTLSGANIYSGTTKVTAGTLIITNPLALQNSPLDTSGAGTLNFSGLTATPTLGGLTGATGNLAAVLGTAGTGYNSITNLTLNLVAGTQTYSGIIANGAAGMTLTKTGAGTQILAGANTYTGDTIINAGTLSIGATGSLSSSSALKISGGAFSYGNTTASQTLNGLTVGAGNATVSNTVAGQTLALGAITRTNDQYGTLNFATLTGTISTTTGNANGIIGPWATTGSGTTLRYAVGSSDGSTPTSITALTGTAATANLANVTDAAVNYEYAAAATTTANLTGNTLRYSGAATTTAIGASNTLTLNGLMNAGTGLLTISGVPSTGGILIGSTGELVIAANTQPTTISAAISGTGRLIYNGAGTLLLSSTTSNYSGGTVINAGQIRIASDAALGNSSGSITLNGGVLLGNTTNPQSGNGGGVNITSARDVIVGPAGGGIGAHGNNTFATTGKLTGSGTFSFADITGGAGGRALQFNATNNDFTGRINIGSREMTLQVQSLADSSGAGNIAFNLISGVSGSTFAYGAGATSALTLNNRAIEINGAAAFTATLSNLNTTRAITINTDLIATGAGAKTLSLSAEAGPTNLFAGAISNGVGGGTVAVTKIGAGQWNLSGSNSYTGATTLTAGTLGINSSTALGTGNFVINGNATFDNTSSSAITLTNNNAFTLSNGSPTFTGTQDLNLGTGTVTLSGANRTISVTNSGATLTLGGGVTTDSNGARTLTKDGAGTLALNGAAGTWTGGMNINRGTLKVGNVTALGTGPIAFNSGANAGTLENTTGTLINMSSSGVNIGGNGGTIATITGTAGNNWSLGTLTNTQAGNAVLTVNTVNATFAGINLSNSATSRTLTINGTGNVTVTGAVVNGSTSTASSLTKSGSGTLTLSNTNTYGGATTINAGTLIVGAGGSIGNSLTSVSPGATLGGSGSIGGLVTSAGTISPGATAGAAGTFALNGGLTTNAGTFTFDLGAIGSSDLLNLGSGVLTGTGISTFTLNNLSGFTTGLYTLIDYGSLASGTTLSNFALSAPTLAGFNVALINDTTNGALVLDVTSAGGNPTLSVAPGTVSFNLLQNAPLPTGTSVTITNSGATSNGSSVLITGAGAAKFDASPLSPANIPGSNGSSTSTIGLTAGATAIIGTFNANVEYSAPNMTNDQTTSTVAAVLNVGAASFNTGVGGTKVYGDARVLSAQLGNLNYNNQSGVNANWASSTTGLTATSGDPAASASTATILMYNNTTGTGTETVSMQWRTRTAAEANPNQTDAVLSDIVNLTGMYSSNENATTGTGAFVLQMSYTNAALGSLNEMAIAASGELRLGWNDNGVWKTAVLGNSPGSPAAQFVGITDWNSYYLGQSSADNGTDLASFLGRYGVDPANNVVWAVLNHNSEFAVIPEPSTLVLGGLALLGLAGAGLRRRRLANRNLALKS